MWRQYTEKNKTLDQCRSHGADHAAYKWSTQIGYGWTYEQALAYVEGYFGYLGQPTPILEKKKVRESDPEEEMEWAIKLDKNYRPVSNQFNIGDSVTASPKNGDFEHEFTGTVTGFRNGLAQVEDMESNTFECELEQLIKN